MLQRSTTQSAQSRLTSRAKATKDFGSRTPVWRNGRRGGFKIRWGQPRGGSSPLAGIDLKPLKLGVSDNLELKEDSGNDEELPVKCSQMHLKRGTKGQQVFQPLNQ